MNKFCFVILLTDQFSSLNYDSYVKNVKNIIA